MPLDTTGETRYMSATSPYDRVDCACPWHVVQTEPWREFQALRAIAELPGLRPYLPTEVYRRQAMKHNRPTGFTEEAVRAYFPGYLLVQFDANGPAWAPLLRRNPALRTVRLLTHGGNRPMTLPGGVVEALQARGRPGDGAIDLRPVAPVQRLLTRGESVEIRKPGPYLGMAAIVDRSTAKRVEVLLGMLRVTLDRRDVA